MLWNFKKLLKSQVKRLLMHVDPYRVASYWTTAFWKECSLNAYTHDVTEVIIKSKEYKNDLQ